MEKTKVKDLMVPISEYATVSEDATLAEAVAVLKTSQNGFDQSKYRHRAILIFDEAGNIVGKVDFIAILRSLEPKYDEMLSDEHPLHLGFTRKYQKAILESFKLWEDPLFHICKKAAEIKVKTFMVPLKANEIIEPDAALGEAIHQFVLGHHQSLMVTEGGKVIGVLRLTDVFQVAAEIMMACDLESNST